MVGIAVVAALLAAASVHASTPMSSPVSSKEWLGVLNDWLGHNRFSQAHTCAAVVVARTHAPPKYHEGMPLVRALDVYERAICPAGNVWAIKEGMSNRQVASLAGAPIPWRSGPRCWNYHASKPGTSIDGRAFCFTNGYVTRILTGVHL
jgi:hypothetical protein